MSFTITRTYPAAAIADTPLRELRAEHAKAAGIPSSIAQRLRRDDLAALLTGELTAEAFAAEFVFGPERMFVRSNGATPAPTLIPDDPQDEPRPAPRPARTQGGTDPASLFAQAVEAMQAARAGAVDPAALAALRSELREEIGRVEARALDKAEKATRAPLADALARLEAAIAAPPVVRFAVGTAQPVTIQNARPELREMVRRAAALGLAANLWLTGPAGSGKTTLARLMSEAMGRRFSHQSFAPDITTRALIGGPDVQGRWHETAFIDFYENGGVYLLDEIDAADAAILVCLNAALENGHLAIPAHPDTARRLIKRHPEFVCVAAANTWGTGATAQYVGRTQLDAAFLDRFALAQFAIGYDRDLEARLMPEDRRKLLARLWEIRDKADANKIRRVCGTRQVERAARLVAAGYTDEEILAALVTAWTAEERSKVGAK